ncbi:MAG: phosphatase PAP2 family protein [Blastocatellales bacterium]
MKSRSSTIKLTGLALSLLLALPTELFAISAQPLNYPNSRLRERRAGFWRTYALAFGAEVLVPPPPHSRSHRTRAELAELRRLQQQRTPEIQARIDFWNAAPAFKPWTETQLDLIRNQSVNPPRAHRGLALVHAAIYDAVVAAWFWKYVYHRARPDRLDRSLSPSVEPPIHPTYPSEHAAIAGAAARMLGYLFPSDAARIKANAKEAAFSRLRAGVNYRSDIEAGFELGGAVAELMISRRAMNDGSFATWDCVVQPGRLTGPGFWEPTSAPFDLCPPAGRTPTEPLAGEWRTWVIPSSERFLAEPPPGFNLYGTNQTDVCNLLEQPARELMDHVAATRAELPGGPRNALIARWAGPPAVRWNLITLELLARDKLNLPRAARISALVNVALADSLQVSWKSKYKYWTARPQTIIRQCRFDQSFTSVRPTPRDPSYTSGNSTCGGVAAEVLSFFFPIDTDSLREEAEGGGISRLYDGTHWRFDVDAGLAIGRRMAPLFIERAKRDGAHPAR